MQEQIQEPYPDEYGFNEESGEWTVKGGEAEYKIALKTWRLSQNFPVIRFFAWQHLPQKLQAISKPFCELAFEMAVKLPSKEGEEVNAMLRKLLEAKDCAVRAAVA